MKCGGWSLPVLPISKAVACRNARRILPATTPSSIRCGLAPANGDSADAWRVRIAPRLLVNDVESQLLATRAGRGIARVLSYQVADDIAAGTLVSLLEGFAPPPLPVQLVARSGPHMQPKVRAFLDHAAAELRGLPVIRPAAG